MSAEESRPLLGDESNGQHSAYISRLRAKKFTTLEKVLVPLATVFFVSLGVLAGVYIKYINNEHTHPPSIIPKPPSNGSSAPLCLTPECVLTAAQVLKDIDTTLDPCDDFFEYTCSKWAKSHDFPQGTAWTSAFLALNDQNKESLRNILSGTLDDFYEDHLSQIDEGVDRNTDKKVFEKAKNMYSACMNENSIDARGAEPILPLLKEIHSLLSTSHSDETVKPKTLAQVLSFLTKKNAGSPFMFTIEADSKNPTVNAISLYQSGLSLPSREYYDREDYVQLLQEAIANTLDIVYRKSFDSSASTARLIVDFEKKIARNSEFYEYYMDPERIYNLLSISELRKIAPAIDWKLYIDSLTPVGTPVVDSIIVTSPDYAANISHLLESETSRTLEAYFTWQVIFSYVDALGETVRAPLRSLNYKLTGLDPKVVKPRWVTCVEEINLSLGFLAGRYYVIDNFSASTKKRADEFVDSIKDAFVKRLPELTWIDDATRAKAVEKIGTLRRKIGYPDTSPDIMSPGSLLNYYDGLDLKAGDYFGNFEKSREFAVAKLWSGVGQAPNRAAWLMSPQEVNAYYNPTSNDINFPAGILQNPLFGDNYPDYMNYGGIGAVIGHELTHGYDSMGRQFDGSGRLVDWWTNETIAKFDEKAKCFVEQYNNFTVIGEDGEPIRLNGKLTLAENLADNGGLSESYFAWKQRYDSDRESKVYNNVRLPGLEQFSLEQMFFINFGRIWCDKLTLAQYKKQVLTDEHSPRRWRVNGAIQNSRAFSQAFNCPAGSRMNPVKKCELW